ncbi:MAG: hypothetical protein VW931_03835, partial [Alphaproteobacteria bacterium]
MPGETEDECRMSEVSLEADLIGALDDLPANAGAGLAAATRNQEVFARRPEEGWFRRFEACLNIADY